MENNKISLILTLKDKVMSLPRPKSKWWLGGNEKLKSYSNLRPRLLVARFTAGKKRC